MGSKDELAKLLSWGSKEFPASGIEKAVSSAEAIAGEGRIKRLLSALNSKYMRVMDLILSYSSMNIDIDQHSYEDFSEPLTEGLLLTIAALEKIDYSVDGLDNIRFYYKVYTSVLTK